MAGEGRGQSYLQTQNPLNAARSMIMKCRNYVYVEGVEVPHLFSVGVHSVRAWLTLLPLEST